MTKIHYVTGDVLDLKYASPSSNIIIPHICNNKGGWGSGFVVALSNRSKIPEYAYKGLVADRKLDLGRVQFINMNTRVWVANMLAQNGYINPSNPKPVDYEYLTICLKKVGDFASRIGAEIHGPRFGAGLGGGKWEEIEKLIEDNLCSYGSEVFIYSLE